MLTAVQVNRTRVELVQGDITRQHVDAIVNAANESLLGGGGVDGAIHRAAGPGLLAETRTLGGCATGDARMTLGYQLPARHVIHAVGPVYSPTNAQAPTLLAGAYRRSLELAEAAGLSSLALPSISTGAYRYPLHLAAPIALTTVCDFAGSHLLPSLVRFVLFDARTLAAYAETLAAIAQSRTDVTSASSNVAGEL